jgi:hypothetical protein
VTSIISEDYLFKHMRKNQYEESLFGYEDDMCVWCFCSLFDCCLIVTKLHHLLNMFTITMSVRHFIFIRGTLLTRIFAMMSECLMFIQNKCFVVTLDKHSTMGVSLCLQNPVCLLVSILGPQSVYDKLFLRNMLQKIAEAHWELQLVTK